MKKIAVIVNASLELTATQTTTLILSRAVDMGLEVHVVDVDTLHVDEHDHIACRARALQPAPNPAAQLAALARQPEQPLTLDALDLVWVRTNPARDERAWAHHNMLPMLSLLSSHGVPVINDPRGLELASSKLYLSYLPQSVRPRTVVAREKQTLLDFFARVGGPCVIKPLRGTRGRDVFRVDGPEAPNLPQLLDLMTRHDYVIAQEFVPEALRGDVRLVVVQGELLTVDGHVAAVHRVPGSGDFRSNLHAGGSARRALITDAMREVVTQIRPVLVRDGIFMAGVDLIGDKIVEINVFSPGGTLHAQRLNGPDFTTPLIERAMELCR